MPNHRPSLHRPLALLLASTLTLSAWAQSAPPRQADTYYAAGTVVSFNGRLYRAVVNQTDWSSTGWNPSLASLWTDIGPAGSGSPAPAPTPAPTPAPAPVPSPAPAPASAGSWNASTAYTSGQTVTRNGATYRANWWTQGDDPATNNGPTGSGKPWTQVAGTPAPPAPAPAPTPAPTPAPAPAPSPAPTPSPPPPAGSLPRHALVGYWHNFSNPSGSTFPLRQVSADFDVVVVAFADDAGNGNVSFSVDASAGSEAQFIADVAELRRRGKKVVLSFGGQNGTVSLNSDAQVANFVSSTQALMNRFGFDGIDLDLESGAGVTQGAAVQRNLVTAVKQLRQRVGAGFYLSMAPEHPYVQGGYVAFSGIWGAYLPIIDGLRDELSLLHVQYYNNGALYTPYSGSGLAEGSTDLLVAASRMLIEGFTTNNGSGPYVFRGLRPDQVALGLPSGPASANSGLASAQALSNALNCLTRLTNCGSVRPLQAYPSFRGVMTWSINWDRKDGFGFSRATRAALDALP